MRLFFTFLSIIYITGIFLFADSSVVSDLSSFNPYSLLHIPLYGILTFLLIFSFVPLKFNPTNPSNPRARFLLPGGIALIIAIADEIHQVYVPGRDASVTDVLLDLCGIALVLFFFFRLLKTKTSSTR
jgi:VanZ family protein